MTIVVPRLGSSYDQRQDGAPWLPQGPEPLPAPVARAIHQSPYAFFRLANRAWAGRVCYEFAGDLESLDQVRLHGDAHVEQYAVTDTSYGLDDFDDTAEGPAVIDLVRFLGSLRLAERERGWTGQFDRLATAFLRGYRRGLSDPAGPEPLGLKSAEPNAAGLKPRVHRELVPRVVQRLRQRPIRDQAAFLEWADELMKPVSPHTLQATRRALELLAAQMMKADPQRPATYFGIKRVGSLELGFGSRGLPKLLVRVEGPTAAANDDVILEAKEPANLIGIECLAPAEQSDAVRVIAGAEQIGRLRHDLLSLVPSLIDQRATHHWWIHDWEPSYVEVTLHDLRSAAELSELSDDAGFQLGSTSLPVGGELALQRRRREARAIATLDARLRQVSLRLADDLLAAWSTFTRDRAASVGVKP